MPSRPATLVIVAFWLVTAGWFVAREFVPKWRSGEPPPYTIELADEAQRVLVPFRWTCTLNGRKIGTVRTAIGYRSADDTYELSATCQELTLPGIGPISIVVRDFEDRVRVTRDGELRSLSTAGTVLVRGLPQVLAGRFSLSADVEHDRLLRHAEFESPGVGRYNPPLPPSEAPRGTVLNPMHPVPRITGLRPGQTWRQPLTDPRSDILRAVIEQSEWNHVISLPKSPEALTAVVLPEPQVLEGEGQPQPCWVIEYRDGEDYTARTWVRQPDGTVVRQEAGTHGETMVLQKE